MVWSAWPAEGQLVYSPPSEAVLKYADADIGFLHEHIRSRPHLNALLTSANGPVWVEHFIADWTPSRHRTAISGLPSPSS